MIFGRAICETLAVLAITCGFALAQALPAGSANRELLKDAWFTGPILAPSAATLPRGHFLIEPYFYDVIVQGRYDNTGTRRTGSHENEVRSLTYMLYGLSDKVTVGLIPTGGYNKLSGRPSSSGLEPGDLTLDAEYRLTQFHEGSWHPATAAVVQETLPTGKYDRLGTRTSNGLGSGAYTTTLGLYTQTYFWLPNGRILRARFNLSQAFSQTVHVQDASVYATEAGFRGHAHPGRSTFVDLSSEYSLTRRWVLALDATYRYNANTRVNGYNVFGAAPGALELDSGSGYVVGLAPAVEYNWRHNLGFLLGSYVIVAGRNTSATITPVVAINFWR
jgi:hypothetical protein